MIHTAAILRDGPLARTMQALLLAVVYCVVARASLGLSFASSNASPVWPPSGIALAALLLGGPRLAPGVLLGAFVANLSAFLGNGAAPWGIAALASACIAGGNLAEAALAAWWVRRAVPGTFSDTPQGVYVFAAAALAAAAVSATCGVATLVASGIVPRSLGPTVWLTWWLGDVTGLLVIAPLLLQLRRAAPTGLAWRDALIALGGFALAGALAFGGLFVAGHADRLAAYGLVVFIAVAAWRHGSLGAALATLGVAALSIGATLQARGPFAKATVNDSLVSLDGFLALCAITGLVIAASSHRGRSGEAKRGERRLPAFMLLAALGITLFTWHVTALDTERRAAERFSDLADEVSVRMLERMTVYEQALRGARGLFDASDSVSEDEWHRYVQSLNIAEYYPGIQGIGYAEVIRAGGRADHVQGRRAAGRPDYDVRPPGERAESTGIVYLEPLDDRNRRAIGYDMFSEPVRRTAMERARDTGQPALSGKVRLVQEVDREEQAGFLMYLPVYRRGLPLDTVAQRRAALSGYVYSPFRMGDLMGGISKRVNLDAMSLSVFDGEAPADGAEMFSHGADLQPVSYPHQFTTTSSLALAGHRWSMNIRSTQAFEASVDTQKAQIALVAGTLISLLLFTVVRSLSVMGEKALTLAEQMSAARAEAERRFESLAQSAADAILVLDARGRVEFCNHAGGLLLGRPPQQVAGRELPELLELDGGFDAWKHGALLRGAAMQELRTLRYGERAPAPVEASLATWTAEQGPYYSLTLRDISARREAEESLHAAVQQARQASLAKSQFLANMSHEIRTPMNAVIGLSYLMGQTSLDDTQANYLAKIRLASKSLLALINDILDLSKVEAGELAIERAPFKLRHLLKDLDDVMGVHAQAKAIALQIDAPESLPTTLDGDATRLSQVLTNLLTNAIKFTESGGVVLRVREVASDTVGVRLRFTVQDSGIGIAPDVQARLFVPFAQADASTTRRFGGTGLGLSIVKRLVSLMDGSVSVQSALGAGSEFAVEIPFALAVQESPMSPSAARPRPGEQALPGVRVLVTDDSDINLEVARRILELEGAHVALACNGQEACDRLQAAPRDFDVVLMDVQMPTLDGYEATRRIRDVLGLTALPVLALSAGALTSERQRATDAGMNDFISKPFDPRSLLMTVRRHVRHERLAAAAAGAAHEAAGGATTHEVAAPADWPDIEGVDRADARARLGGDVALFRVMLRRLLGEFSDVGSLAAGLEAAALPALAARMHKLRGGAGSLGMEAIHPIAGAAEAACRAGELAEVRRLAGQLAEHLQALQSRAESFLVPPPEPPVRVEDAALADRAGASGEPADARLLAELAQLLREQNLIALERFTEKAAQFRRLLGPRTHAAVREHIDNLQFDAALAALEHGAADAVA